MYGRGKGGKRLSKGGAKRSRKGGDGDISGITKPPGLFGYATAHSSVSSKSKRNSTSRRQRTKSKRKSLQAQEQVQEHSFKSTSSKLPIESPSITPFDPMSENHESEVQRMRREFSTLLAKWSEIQQQLAQTLEAPRPTLATTDVAESTSPIRSPTKFIRHRMTRSATPPPTMRNGELSMHSTVSNSGVRAVSMIAMSDDEDAMKVPDAADEKDRQIKELKEKIASLEKENHDLVLQTAADKDAAIRETNTAVDRMSTSLAAMQQHMKEQSVTRQHLEKLATNQLEERKQLIDDIATLKQQNEHKDVIISETNAELQQMAASLAAMQKTLKARTERERVTSKQGMLTKVQGQSMEHLRLGRKSRKHVFFAGNRLFWRDATGASTTYKSIEVREVLNRVVVTAENLKKMNKESIEKYAQRPWFLVIGQQRCALFEADSGSERDAWIKFIKRALRQGIE